jgi:hypothetical protein
MKVGDTFHSLKLHPHYAALVQEYVDMVMYLTEEIMQRSWTSSAFTSAPARLEGT